MPSGGAMFECNEQGSVAVISGDDPLNTDFLPRVRTLIDECLQKRPPKIVINLRSVPLIDGAGLELLWDTRDQCMRRGGMMELAAANPLCRDIITCTPLAEQFVLFDDVLTAVGSFAQ